MRSRSRVFGKKSESWQVIYMDLMTIIMVFFVILWSTHQKKNDGVSETVGDQTARMVNLPGDILFSPGKSKLTPEGKDVFSQLFRSDEGGVLNFQSGGLTKRMLYIHGHTDSDGKKEKNIRLAFDRAYSTYREIKRYTVGFADHVAICSHADNTPETEIPRFSGKVTRAQRDMVRSAKAKNRRITIEDKFVNRFSPDEGR